MGPDPYLLKRHCMCCGEGGFRASQCPKCVASYCVRCNSSTTPDKLIATFYLRLDEVPYPVDPYGDIDCFLGQCVRRGASGFKTDQDMRMHARLRHRMEYQTFLESQGGVNSEIADLRRLVMEMQAKQAQPVMVEPEIVQQVEEAETRLAQSPVTTPVGESVVAGVSTEPTAEPSVVQPRAKRKRAKRARKRSTSG